MIITDYSISFESKEVSIIKNSKIEITELIKDINNWHTQIAKIILDIGNLYYYATNKNDSLYPLSNLSAKQKRHVQTVLTTLVKEPEKYYSEYIKKTEIFNQITNCKSIANLEEIASTYKLSTKEISDNLDKSKNNLLKKLYDDYKYGIFGELLFYNVVENILKKELLLSKVSFITAPGTYSHGSDGIFIDEKNKILYFGEAKFSNDFSLGLVQATSSMNDCIKRIKNDQAFLVNHTRDLKRDYENIIDIDTINDYKNEIIIFCLHGVEIDNDIIQEIAKQKIPNLQNKLNTLNFRVISFPIKDKENLKLILAKEIESYDKNF